MSPQISPLFWLLFFHALADFSLQSDAMAKGKNRNRVIDQSSIPPGAKYVPCWPYWLTAHAMIHGGGVAIALGSVSLGIFEAISHWAIDFLKCENILTVHEDQGLHVACKVLWWAMWLHGIR